MNSKQLIIHIIEKELERARKIYIEACCNSAANKASSDIWDSFNKDDGIGGISQNYYHISKSSYKDKELNARRHMDELNEAYLVAVKTFLE